MLASEVAPFAKTGGLADVVGALPQVLARRGHDVRVIMPLHRSIDRARYRLLPLLRQMVVQWGTEQIVGGLMRCPFPGAPEVPVYFVQQDALFDRPALYGEGGRDYPDNDRRFAFFCMASLWAMKALDFQPDILHLHDWQAGLVAPLLRHHPVMGNDGFYANMRTVFTIHNLAYQGLFPPDFLAKAQLPWTLFTPEVAEFHKHLSLLKAGIVLADQVTTVSPTYAREIQTTDYGCGLEGVLRARADRLTGILNGIDTRVWNPAADPYLAAPYSADAPDGKTVCRAALCADLGLEPQPGAPVVGIISRLVDQKGFDLVAQAMPTILASGAAIAIVGTGDKKHEDYFTHLAAENPKRVSTTIAYREDLAHRIEGGADIFLMPSRFEPSGLNQLYSMRYGTLPLVRRVGGLADSVIDATLSPLGSGDATGFVFDDYSCEALLEAWGRALRTYRDEPHHWRRMMVAAMRRDSSWDRAAPEYERIYDAARA